MDMKYDPDTFVPGEMDTAPHQDTFAGFMKTCIVVTLATIFVLIFLAIIGV